MEFDPLINISGRTAMLKKTCSEKKETLLINIWEMFEERLLYE
jgi:hypothetical protein